MLTKIKKGASASLETYLDNLTQELRKITETESSNFTRLARSAMLTVDYSGQGNYRKRTFKSSEPIEFRLDKLRVGASGILVVLAPLDQASAYKVSDNDKWRVEIKIVDFLTLSKPLVHGDLQRELCGLNDLMRQNPAVQQIGSEDGRQMAYASLVRAAAEALKSGRAKSFVNQLPDLLFGMEDDFTPESKSPMNRSFVNARMIEEYGHLYDEIGDFS